jgi:hypothetical protein
MQAAAVEAFHKHFAAHGLRMRKSPAWRRWQTTNYGCKFAPSSRSLASLGRVVPKLRESAYESWKSEHGIFKYFTKKSIVCFHWFNWSS